MHPRSVPPLRRAATLVLLAFTPLVIGCGILGPELSTEGVVRYQGIEGGCWLLDAEGQTYSPVDLPAEFRTDGLRVRFEADILEDYAGFCPGQSIELRSIERAD